MAEVKFKPGDEFIVNVDGIDYKTTIDAHGTQRFVENRDHFLVKRIRDSRFGSNPEGDILDLNDMAIRFHKGEFSVRDYMEMNMSLGYSVCGFDEINQQTLSEPLTIKNPLWE